MNNFFKIHSELQERGERIIRVDAETELIYCRHGNHTYNTWKLDDNGQLICIDCRTDFDMVKFNR
jgi:hypothetical protein